MALRHDTARRQPDEGAAAGPRLRRRRPQGRRPAARLPARRSASTPIYFNPIFDAASNHWLRHAGLHARSTRTSAPRRTGRTSSSTRATRGMRVILDGVFNHLSSDSPIFDRYHHYPTVGACESTSSPYRSWFTFRAPVGQRRRHLRATRAAARQADLRRLVRLRLDPRDQQVEPGRRQAYFLTGSELDREALAPRRGLRLAPRRRRRRVASRRATGRRSGASSRRRSPSALTVSETWQKDSTLLRMIRGDRLDTTMNYRLRDAVIGVH